MNVSPSVISIHNRCSGKLMGHYSSTELSRLNLYHVSACAFTIPVFVSNLNSQQTMSTLVLAPVVLHACCSGVLNIMHMQWTTSIYTVQYEAFQLGLTGIMATRVRQTQGKWCIYWHTSWYYTITPCMRAILMTNVGLAQACPNHASKLIRTLYVCEAYLFYTTASIL